MRRSIPLLTVCLALAGAAAIAEDSLSPDEQALIQRRNGMTAEQFAAYLPYIHPRVVEPVGGGVRLDVPDLPANRRLAEMGIVDVTAAPFSADRSGEGDATDAIQAAVNFARDHQMVLYFPPGTYRISDTIECRQQLTFRGNGRLTGAANFPCVLIGSADPAKRSTIYLAPRSRGFTDPEERKIAVHFTNCNYGYDYRDFENSPLRPQANINYNQLLLDIDITIGEGNAGAIALRMQAAEGSSAQSIRIDATHGHTGMLGAAGSGGSHHDITVLGGRVGIDTRGFPPEFGVDSTGTQPTPTMSAVTLLDQTETALINKSRGPLIAVGWRIRTKTSGPVIRLLKDYGAAPYNSGLALIDSVIDFDGAPGEVVCDAPKSFYMRDVYVRGAAEIVQGVPTVGDGWTRVEELAYPVQPQPFKGQAFHESILWNGERFETPYLRATSIAGPPADPCGRHTWGAEFPSFQSPGAVNVKDAPYNAAGDAVTDDTAALQRAIDENEIVFLPKGYYRLSDTLRLRPNTKLVGVAPHLSVLMTRSPYGRLAEGDAPRPLVETADTADAETVLSFVGIHLMNEAPEDVVAEHNDVLPFFALSWRCGGDSIVRSPYIARKHLYGYPMRKPQGVEGFGYAAPTVRISGHGGGKWYNFFIHGLADDADDYRHLLVENTQGPLAFYHLHAQHADSFAQCEIRDSANVDIYGVKTEYQTRFLKVENSDHVRIHGHGGNATAIRDSAHYIFIDSDDVTITNMSDQFNIRQTAPQPKAYRDHMIEPYNVYGPIIEIRDGAETAVPYNEDPILWRRGPMPVAPTMEGR